jgi:hypothetical protein
VELSSRTSPIHYSTPLEASHHATSINPKLME